MMTKSAGNAQGRSTKSDSCNLTSKQTTTWYTRNIQKHTYLNIRVSGGQDLCGPTPHTGRWVQHRQTNKESNTHTLTLHIQETHRKAPVSPKDPEELAGRGAQHCKVGLSLQPNKKPRRNTKSRRSFPKTMILGAFLHCRNACCVVGSSYQTSQNFSNYQ